MTGLYGAVLSSTLCSNLRRGHRDGSIACDNPERRPVGACVRMLHANAGEHGMFEALTNCDDDVSVAVLAQGMVSPQKTNRGRTQALLVTLTDGQSWTNAPVCSWPEASRPGQEIVSRVTCERIAHGLHCCLSGASPEVEDRLAQHIYTAVSSHDDFAKPCPPLAECASEDNDTGMPQN